MNRPIIVGISLLHAIFASGTAALAASKIAAQPSTASSHPMPAEIQKLLTHACTIANVSKPEARCEFGNGDIGERFLMGGVTLATEFGLLPITTMRLRKQKTGLLCAIEISYGDCHDKKYNCQKNTLINLNPAFGQVGIFGVLPAHKS